MKIQSVVAGLAGLALLVGAGPAAAGPGDPYNGIDVSLIDKSTNKPLIDKSTNQPFQTTLPGGLYGTAASFTVPAGVFGNLSVTLPLGTATLTRLTLDLAGNGAGTFAFGVTTAGVNGLGGALPLVGTLRGMAFGGAVTAFSLSLGVVGAGGTATATGVAGPVALQGGLWGTGPVSAAGDTFFGSDQRTQFGQGPVQLVAPMVVQTSIGDFGTAIGMNLTFVPEPSVLSLLAPGIAVLAGMGARRTRRRR